MSMSCLVDELSCSHFTGGSKFNLVPISPAVLEKINILNLRYPGQRSVNDLFDCVEV